MSYSLCSSLTVQLYATQLNTLTNWTTALDVYSVLMPKDLVGSSLIGRLKHQSWRSSSN
jgi:hypothetical protein